MPVIIAAAAAILIVLARACLQSITIDEADTYLAWVARPYPSHWEAASNNHLLNSLLMRLTTSIFGPSHLAVRLPALTGALIYIACCYFLTRLMPRGRLTVFICLVFNPFVMDYLVAARGYSLAMAFLMAAFTVWAYARQGIIDDFRAAGLCSICIVLSFSANFSFAFVDAAALLIMLAACRSLKLAAAYILPGILLITLLPLSTVLTWPGGQLGYGSTSLLHTFRTVIDSSLYQPNPYLLNPLLLSAFQSLRSLLIPLLAVAVLYVCVRRFVTAGCPRLFTPFAALALAPAAALILALALHWVACRFFHLLMPQERTAIFIVPLLTLTLGALASRPSGRPLRATLTLLALYFLSCQRLTYFREWSWNADAHRIYSILTYYNHRYGIRDIPTTWKCRGVLNYYRETSGRETLEEFTSVPGEYPPGRRVYVLDLSQDSHIIGENHLKLIYRGPVSEIGVAIDPHFDAPGPPLTAAASCAR